MDRKLYRTASRRGFSLVETLIVVSIVAIVATIAIPLLLNARRASLDQKAQNSLRSLISAEQNYFIANGHYASLDELLQTQPPLLNRRFQASGDGLGHGIRFNIESASRGLSFVAEVENPGGNHDFSSDESFEIKAL